ncbi:hypothetical protein GCM10022268_00240 [Sphingomonas cynarae]|uniref:Uncharacterized protein n=1 Tax=Sphingomonas cynarae TaxID=930197 RepID=A0ABP7CMT8_9SPHN
MRSVPNRRPCVPALNGLFLLGPSDYANYVARVSLMQLRDKSSSASVDPNAPVINFGEAI